MSDFLLKVHGTDLFHFVDGHATWDGYLTDMAQDGTWGDHVILWAAANCYQIAIHVISSLPGHSEVIINPDCPFDESHHLLLGHVHEVHYVSLQPLQGKAQNITHLKTGLLYREFCKKDILNIITERILQVYFTPIQLQAVQV